MRTRLVLASVTAPVLALLLASCALVNGTEPTAVPTPSKGSSSATATPTDDDVLFTITADLMSPEGSTVRVVETAHAPVSADNAARSAWSASHCEASNYDLDAPAVVRFDVTARVAEGPAPDSDYLLVVSAGGDAQHPTGYTGDLRTFQAYCADGILSMPGSGTGWTGFAAADDWATSSWGMSASDGAGDSTRVMTPVRCDFARGPASEDVDLPAGWEPKGAGSSCIFGPQGA